ncbi:MAG: phage tail protein [Gammaproteobacteria bacterium]
MPDPYVGEIRMFGGNFAPAGWEFCNGQLLQISENETLFTLIGATYGGDGQGTFGLPNLQSRIPLHMGTGPDGAAYQIGEMAGTEQETLTVQRIPNHTHPLAASTDNGGQNNPAGNVLAAGAGSVFPYIADPPGVNMSPQAISPVGGSRPHENVQPLLCVNYIISMFGIFPSPT